MARNWWELHPSPKSRMTKKNLRNNGIVATQACLLRGFFAYAALSG
jgi:hypothetical protein